MLLTRKSEMPVSQWSGGTTTQLMIYPATAEYAKRDFLFRISSAKVDLEESTFTHLPGVHRHLIILEGEMEIFHQGHHTKKLKPFDIDEFEGDWQTSSKGKVTDFNLMLRNGASGSLEYKKLNANESMEVHNVDFDGMGFYLHRGEIEIGDTMMFRGDFVFIEASEKLVLKSIIDSEIIVAKIKF